MIALAGCEGSGDGGTSSGSFESEAGMFEAGPSGDGGFTSDTSLPPDAAMGTGVTVIVGATGAPKANVRVIFQDSSGAVIGQGTTDATGSVVSTALPSMVTVLYSSPVGPAPITFLGVNDGDTLHVVPAFEAVPDGTQVGTISVALAANTIVANSPFLYAYVQASGQCRNTSDTSPITGPLFDYCVAATNDVFVEAANESTALGYALLKNVAPPVANGNVSVGPVTVTASGTRTLVATNLPNADSNPDFSVWAVAGLQKYFLDASSGAITDVSGTSTPVPIDSIDAVQSEVFTNQNLNGGDVTNYIMNREALTTTASGALASVDFSTALPTLTNAVAATATSVARPDLTFTTSAAPTAAAGLARLQWQTTSATGTWTFVFPGATTSFKAPALPLDAATFTPAGTVLMTFAGYVGGGLVPSYAALKALPIAPDATPALFDDQQPMPANGNLKLTTWELVTD